MMAAMGYGYGPPPTYIRGGSFGYSTGSFGGGSFGGGGIFGLLIFRKYTLYQSMKCWTCPN